MSHPPELSATVLVPAAEPDGGAAANDSAPLPETCTLTFTGSGKEYFRIWIVNLFLSVVTLGIYSAWAKVRRLQYFDRNTELAGAVFDFRGDPKAILKGRLLGVALLGAYHYAFGFSLAFGLVVFGLLLAALPFLMRSALRFRLRNTVYRGLPFDFGGSTAGAYRAYLPPLLTVLLPALTVALDPSGKTMFACMLLYLGWPLMHGATKRYQHAHIQYGAEQSRFDGKTRRFFKPYLAAFLLAIGAMLAAAALGGVMIALAVAAKGAQGAAQLPSWLPIAMGALMGYACYLFAGPYLQVRVANLMWSHTAFPGIAFDSRLSARSFIWLQTKNALLTLLTLGLYRPFAVVRVYQYRLAHLTLRTQGGIENILAGAARPPASAAGDGVADFLGVDLSW